MTRTALVLASALLVATQLNGCSAQKAAAPTQVPTANTVRQLEIGASPSVVAFNAKAATTASVGLYAVGKLVEPQLEGVRLADEMLPGSSLLMAPDGKLTFSYADSFSTPFQKMRQYDADGLNLLELDAEQPRPKILDDAHQLNVTSLELGIDGGILWFDGEIIYRFELGRPLSAFRLQSADGLQKTVITGPNKAQVLASSDMKEWSLLAESDEKSPTTELSTSLPASLLTSGTVYLKLKGKRNGLVQLFVSAELAAPELAAPLSFAKGRSERRYTDAQSSSHKALLYLPNAADERVGLVAAAPLSYPDKTTVTEDGDQLIVSFAEQVELRLQRAPGKGIRNLASLRVGQQQLLAASATVSAPAMTLDLLSDDSVGNMSDWKAYLLERQAAQGQWPPKGERVWRSVRLDEAEYLGYKINDDNSVTVQTQITDQSTVADVDLVIAPRKAKIGANDYRGLAFKLNVSGLPQAGWWRYAEPVVTRYQHWSMQQTWGSFVEARHDFTAPLVVSAKYYNGDAQPFFFMAGSQGAMVSYFDEAVAARVAVAERADRVFNVVRVPLSQGTTLRSSPFKRWLWSDTAFNKWSAIDAWTDGYDAIAKGYRSKLGVGVTEPKPLVSIIPSDMKPYTDYMASKQKPALESSWLYGLQQKLLPQAAALGFGAIYIDGIWKTDGEHEASELLPGGQSTGSLAAPWQLEISDAIGGKEALASLVKRADELGVKIQLWIAPAHLSNSSPLLVEHPDWVKWRVNGHPEDSGYEDLMGTSLNSGYYDYAIGSYADIREATGVHGVTTDSFLTFGLFLDGREPQPTPQLSRMVAMQSALRKMGMSEIYIEGCGPFGISGGGFGGDVTKSPEERSINRREYGLYRYVLDYFPGAQAYYRTLAAKGVVDMPGQGLTVIQALPDEQRELVARANRDYLKVLGKLGRRQLIGKGSTWQGVRWTNESSADVVVFAFEAFQETVPAGATIEDLSADAVVEAQGSFETKPWHTYLIRVGQGG